jgi:hypothetical protein
MDKIDEVIRRALFAEEQRLLSEREEPGYFAQAATASFRGPTTWVMVILNAALAAFWMWKMSMAADAATAIKWGVSALVCFQLSMLFLLLMHTLRGARMEANRLLREIKRIELQVAMLRDATPGARASFPDRPGAAHATD